jgi:hypothetical protein
MTLNTNLKTMIKIESSIPIPKISKKGRQKLYPFEEMNVGDSFYMENRTASQLSSGANNWAKAYNPSAKFVAKNEKKGARIWRYQ